MELTDLTPRNVDFFIMATGDDGKEQRLDLTFRKWTLRDDEWQARRYKKITLEKMFRELDLFNICRIAFYMLTNDSKKEILGIKLIDIDEEGIETEIKSGPEKLRAIVSGATEQIKIYTSLLEAKGLSLPILNEAVNEELKKNGLEPVDLTGLLSTTR